MQEKLLTIKEVAEYLGTSEENVKDLVASGALPAYKVGGLLIRFKREQIENYAGRAGQGANQNASLAAVNRPAESDLDLLSSDRRLIKDSKVFKRRNDEMPYSILEKFENFLYYNDFYILSLILLALAIFAIFEI